MEEREGYTFFSFFFDPLLFKELNADMTGRDDGVFKRVKVGSRREEVWEKLKEIGKESKNGEKILGSYISIRTSTEGEKASNHKKPK